MNLPDPAERRRFSAQRFWARAVYHPTLAYNYILGRGIGVRRWWDAVNDHLILGAVPFRRDIPKLSALGVTGVVNMCEEYGGPLREYAAHGIEQLWLPTTDFQHPSAAFVEQGAAFVQTHAEKQGITYVHCKAGRARSATIGLWWLVRYHSMTPWEAQQCLQVARPHVNPRVYERPVIVELYKQLLTERSSTVSTENEPDPERPSA